MAKYAYPLLALAVLASLSISAPVEAGGLNARISEMFFNPNGTDGPNEFVELRTDVPSSSFPAGTYLIGIEGDSTSTPGDVNFFFDLSGISVGSNGYLVLLQAGNTYTVDPASAVIVAPVVGFTGVAGYTTDNCCDMENASTTFVLVTSPTPPTITDDYDANNDGALDGGASSWAIHDSVGVTDAAGDISYGAISFQIGGGIANGTVVPATFAGYLARTRLGPNQSYGSAVADWVGDTPLQTAPPFTLSNSVSGSSNPAQYVGLALNHVGAANWPTLPVELQQFSIE